MRAALTQRLIAATSQLPSPAINHAHRAGVRLAGGCLIGDSHRQVRKVVVVKIGRGQRRAKMVPRPDGTTHTCFRPHLSGCASQSRTTAIPNKNGSRPGRTIHSPAWSADGQIHNSVTIEVANGQRRAKTVASLRSESQTQTGFSDQFAIDHRKSRRADVERSIRLQEAIT